jgi:hypothetical protein
LVQIENDIFNLHQSFVFAINLNIQKAFIVAPISGESYPIAKNVTVTGIRELVELLRKMEKKIEV